MRKKTLLFFMLSLFLILQGLNAQTWSSPKRITWGSGDSSNPEMVIDSNQYIHAVWQDSQPGNYEIFYKRSTDGGNTWSAPVRLVWTSGFSVGPYITKDSDNKLYIVWSDDSTGAAEIYFKKSTNLGNSWSGTIRITYNSGASNTPMLAVDPSKDLHLVWSDNTPGNSEIYYKKSVTYGGSWLALKRITWNSGNSLLPIAATDSNGWIHLFWIDYSPGNSEIYYKKSTDGGNSWGATKRMTWNSGESWLGDVVVDPSNNIHMLWDDDTVGNPEVYHRKSTDGGNNWSTASRLTWNPGNSYNPSVYTDPANGVHVVWYDYISSKFEVFYKKSTNSGGAWGALNRLTWNAGYSLSPRIKGVDGSNLRVLWQDGTPGNNEIFFKKTSGVQPTVTRFTNNTSYTIVSLVIDGYEQYPSSPQGLLPGYYVEYSLTVGGHSYSAQNGYWEGSTRKPLYNYANTFTQVSGVTKKIDFNNPTVNQLLCDFTASHTWTGSYWTGMPAIKKYASFTFSTNGTYSFYDDGSFHSSGTYALVERWPGVFQVVFSVSGFNGYIYETEGYFQMENGPSDWKWIKYYK